MSALTDAEFHRFGRGMWRMPISAFRGTGTVIIVGERGNASLVGADTLTVGPGEIVLVPSGRYEYASVGSQAAIAVATLPAIATELPVATPYLRITPTGGTAASVLRYVVLGLTSDSSSGESPRSPRVGQQLSAIVAATYAEHLSTSSYAAGAVFEEACQHIESRLSDCELGLDPIAGALNVSTRTLNRAFRAQGVTVGEWIRKRRLDQCRIDLEDPRLSHVPVSVLATRWGLTDAAHFSRVFKTEYGMSPRAFRAHHRHAVTVPASAFLRPAELAVAV
jgi:AraC-like DNA-binding protein